MLEFTLPAALAILGFIPVILALYFMRSRPRRHLVSTNRIWEQVLERRRRESVLGRFRNSIFLLLHLALVVLAALALAQPTRPGGLRGDTLFIVDTSASMGATDVPGSRLSEAKRRIRDLVAKLDPDARVALVEAGLRVLPAVPPTPSRERFFAALEKLDVVDCAGPDPGELASFLVAGGRLDYARTYFFTDNCPAAQLADIPGLGAMQLEVVGEAADNLGITAFELSDVAGGKDAAILVRNFGPLPAQCRVTLTAEGGGQLSSSETSIGAGAEQTVVFNKLDIPAGTLTARVAPTGSPDYLACDDTASLIVGQRASRVLLIAAGGSPLEHVLESKKLGLAVTRVPPGSLAAHARELASCDAVVSDGYWGPELEGKNLLLFSPPDPGGPAGGAPVTDVTAAVADPTHPVMKYLSWDDVRVRRGSTLTRKGKPLLSVPAGVLAVACEGSSGRQVILGFPLRETDLPFRVAFPILVANSLSWLTGSEGMTETGKKAGDVVRLPAREPRAQVLANGDSRTVEGRLTAGQLELDVFRKTGVVEVKTDLARAAYAVNLFSIAESNIKPAAESAELEPPPGSREGRQPVWRWFLLAFLTVLFAEWFLWHRLGG